MSNISYYDWDLNWKEIKHLVDHTSMNSSKRLLATLAYRYMIDPTWYRYDSKVKEFLISIPQEEAINSILEIGIIPFSPIEDSSNISPYNIWLKHMKISNTIHDQWMNSSNRDSIRRWALLMNCQVQSIFIYNLVKLIYPDKNPIIIEGKLHTFVMIDTMVFDILWWLSIFIVEIEKEIRDAKIWNDPYTYILEGYGCLTDDELDILKS